MKAVMDITDARNVIKELKEKPFICSKYTIETESGYVITTKSKRPYCNSKKHTNADRIRAMSEEELEEFIDKVNRTCIVNALGGDTLCDYGHVSCTECKAKFCGIQKWLQSEVEE